MSSKILYLECYSGISGDMTVSALLDLGADQEVLKKALESLNVEGYKIEIGRRQKCGIDACFFDVILEGEEHHHEHTHDHHDHSHEHTYEHTHDHHEHHHVHRNIKDIYEIINHSQITDRAKTLSKKIFEVVAKAEAKAHNLPVEEVHFHEVGAVDSIVDIVATAVCIDNLGIAEVVVSELYEGRGHVHCQHGILPVPVPAVANIAMEHALNMKITDVQGELVTPTGAAIAAALKTRDVLPASYKIKNMGIGSGKKELLKANILRAYMIEENNDKKKTSLMDDILRNFNKDNIWLLESNIDDTTGEALGFTMEKLIKQGAKDVFFTPIFMKKNRPAYKLSILCKEDKIKDMEFIIFQNTTTIGIRKVKMSRTILERKKRIIDTPYGPVQVKICKFQDQEYVYPEYEEIKRICNETGLDFQRIYDEIKKQ